QWDREKPRDTWRQAKDDMSHHRIPCLGDLVSRAAHLHQNPSRMSEKASAGVRRGYAASIAMQQGLVQFHFELTHLMTQGGLSNREQRRCLCEAAQIGNVNKVVKLFDIHWLQGRGGGQIRCYLFSRYLIVRHRYSTSAQSNKYYLGR